MQDHQQAMQTPVPGGRPDDSSDVQHACDSDLAQSRVRFGAGQIPIEVTLPGSPGGGDELVHGKAPEPINAHLLELTCYEATVAVSSRIEPGETVFLHLVLKEIDLDLDLFAEVRRPRPAENKSWSLRCSFYPELPVEVLSRLIAGTSLERRIDPRYDVFITVTVRWESGQTDSPATLQNYSRGGFGVLTASADPTGGRLCMNMDHGGRVWSTEAESRWRFKTEEGHLVGCAFVDNKDFETLHQFVMNSGPQPSENAE